MIFLISVAFAAGITIGYLIAEHAHTKQLEKMIAEKKARSMADTVAMDMTNPYHPKRNNKRDYVGPGDYEHSKIFHHDDVITGRPSKRPSQSLWTHDEKDVNNFI
jgi:hypothetical protein